MGCRGCCELVQRAVEQDDSKELTGSTASLALPPTLTDLTDSEVQTLQAAQTFVADAAVVENIFRL
jgi:hypothetical protein